MRWLNDNLGPWLAGLAAGALVVVVFLSVNAVGKSADWAAWVQAVGSIGAIAGTYATTIYSERRGRRAAAEREVAFVRGVIAVAQAGIEALDQAEAAVNGRNEQSLAQALTGSAKVYRQSKRLVKLPVGQWPTPFMLGYLDEYRRALAGIFSSALNVRGALHINSPQHQQDRSNFIYHLKSIRAEADVVIDFCDRWMAS